MHSKCRIHKPHLLSFFKVKRIGPSGGGDAASYNAGVRPLHAPFEMQPYSLIKDPVKVYSETDSPIFSTVMEVQTDLAVRMLFVRIATGRRFLPLQ